MGWVAAALVQPGREGLWPGTGNGLEGHEGTASLWDQLSSSGGLHVCI